MLLQYLTSKKCAGLLYKIIFYGNDGIRKHFEHKKRLEKIKSFKGEIRFWKSINAGGRLYLDIV